MMEQEIMGKGKNIYFKVFILFFLTETEFITAEALSHFVYSPDLNAVLLPGVSLLVKGGILGC